MAGGFKHCDLSGSDVLVGVRGDHLAAGAGAQGHPDLPVDRVLEELDAAVAQRGVEPPGWYEEAGFMMYHQLWSSMRAAGLVGGPDGVEPVPPDAPLDPGVALCNASSQSRGSVRSAS